MFKISSVLLPYHGRGNHSINGKLRITPCTVGQTITCTYVRNCYHLAYPSEVSTICNEISGTDPPELDHFLTPHSKSHLCLTNSVNCSKNPTLLANPRSDQIFLTKLEFCTLVLLSVSGPPKSYVSAVPGHF